MQRIWVIAPYNSELREIWESVWQFDVKQGLISIGWRELGDISILNEDQLIAAINRIFPDYAPQTKTRTFNMLWSFYHSIQPGDIIVARCGRKMIAGVGSVLTRAYYSINKNMEATGPGGVYPNHIDVQWHDLPRNKEFPNMVFGMQTVYEIKEDFYKELMEDSNEKPIEPREEGIQDEAEFTLEKYLEEFIVSNFEKIFRGQIALFHDPEEKVAGQQYGTEVGTIDILAREPSTGSYVVIDLKKGRESDRVVGQTLRYMGWVSENLCKEGEPVKGIIICRDADTKLLYALKMTPDISVKYYKIDFSLNDKPESGSSQSRLT